MKHGYQTFDSDMHVYDAANLYEKYMKPKWGERIPKGQRNGKHGRVEFKLGGGAKMRAITDVIKDVFADTGYTAADIDWFVPHQANKRIIDGSAHKLGIAPEKVVTTVDRHGNTSAASIPLALDVAVKDGRVKRGDLVLLEAMGGGFTWGAVLMRW